MRVILSDVPLSEEIGEASTEAPNLGILYLISYVRERVEGIKFHYLEPFLTAEKHMEMVKNIKPHIYGISFTTIKKDRAYSIINQVKREMPKTLIVSGGCHPTVDPNDVLNNSKTDICVGGEGEQQFLNIIQHYSFYKTVSALAYPNIIPLLSNINFMPAWDMIDFNNYDIPIKKNFPVAYLLPLRGCPFNCLFCSNPVWKAQLPWIRFRSPENIAEEVDYLHKRGVREIYIRADTFNSNLSWAKSVCTIIKGLDLKDLTFQCNLRIDNVDGELIKLMKDMGCWLVHVGIESANDRVLKGINKGITEKMTGETLRLLKNYGIKVYGFFMFYNAWEENGKLEYESTAEVNKTLAFMENCLKENRLEYISWSITNPLIGSQLHKIATKHNIINNENLPFIKMNLPTISKKEMLEAYIKGLALQLKNGFEKSLINQNDRRAFLKFKTLINLLDYWSKYA